MRIESGYRRRTSITAIDIDTILGEIECQALTGENFLEEHFNRIPPEKLKTSIPGGASLIYWAIVRHNIHNLRLLKNSIPADCDPIAIFVKEYNCSTLEKMNAMAIAVIELMEPSSFPSIEDLTEKMEALRTSSAHSDFEEKARAIKEAILAKMPTHHAGLGCK